MNLLIHSSRYITGIVFIFSGITKGIDPTGSIYKFSDYFNTIGLSPDTNLLLILALFLCLTEFIIGFSLIAGIRLRMASYGLLIFMTFFTPLTLILAIFNPVTDCGCFGDALQMTNWQTFIKNVVLSFFTILVYTGRNDFKERGSSLTQWVAAGLTTVIFILFFGYNYRHLPIVDFRPYSEGTNILENMSYPPDALIDEYETTLIYEKEGKLEEFTIDNWPSNDTSWHFVDQVSRLVKKGYTPPIHDFILTDIDGYDLTEELLNYNGFSLLMISKRLSEAPPYRLTTGIAIGEDIISEGISFYLLTSSSTNIVEEYPDFINFLFGDETMLKTIVRSNPGYILLYGGTIVKKWSARDLPAANKIISISENNKPVRETGENYKLILIILVVLTLAVAYSYTMNKIKPEEK